MPEIISFKEMPGVRVATLSLHSDERGFFAEVIRNDWDEFLKGDTTVQSNISFTYPGIIRAWHRHHRGQVDYFIALQGAIKICTYDDREGPTQGRLVVIVSSAYKPQVVRVPGHYWHGFKVVSSLPALVVYFTTRLYDYQNPDEERRPWDSVIAADPSTGHPFNWNWPAHK